MPTNRHSDPETEPPSIGNDRNQEIFDFYSKGYNEILKQQLGIYSVSQHQICRHRIRLLKKMSRPEPVRILEFGCGIGNNLVYLQQAFPQSRIYATDMSGESLKIAKKKNPVVTFFTNQISELNGFFDLILVVNVFHHIQPIDRRKIAEKLLRFLSPKGEIFVFHCYYQ